MGSCHLQTKTILQSFSIWVPFIDFYCLTALAGTFRTMLNGSGESGHPCLVPDFRGKALTSHTESDVSCGLVIPGLMLRYIPCIPNILRVFVMKDVEFFKCFICTC